MSTVHVFVTSQRFRSDNELRSFVEPTYTGDGDMVSSPFMREIGLSSYEPLCIERVRAETARSLVELLRDASYAEQWLNKVDDRVVDTAVCVFAPSCVSDPRASSLTYVGAFEYDG